MQVNGMCVRLLVDIGYPERLSTGFGVSSRLPVSGSSGTLTACCTSSPPHGLASQSPVNVLSARAGHPLAQLRVVSIEAWTFQKYHAKLTPVLFHVFFLLCLLAPGLRWSIETCPSLSSVHSLPSERQRQRKGRQHSKQARHEDSRDLPPQLLPLLQPLRWQKSGVSDWGNTR